MLSKRWQDFTIFYQNQAEFHGLFREILLQHCYYIELESEEPHIIDAGAHIGLSTLYFKHLFPHAQITSIEANPGVLDILKLNIESNRLSRVKVEPVALSIDQEPINFYRDKTKDQWWSVAGAREGSWDGTQQSQSLLVPAKPLADFLDQPVDLLKLDIEGMETSVLKAAGQKLQQVKHLLIEYHPEVRGDYQELLEYLENLNFKITVYKDGHVVPRRRKARGLVIIRASQE